MREIKFRFWGSRLDKMLYPKNICFYDTDTYPEAITTEDMYYVDVRTDFIGDDFKLMQFTGLKDKSSKSQEGGDNKEVYEGDIIKDFINGKQGYVEFVDGSFCIIGVDKFAIDLLKFLEDSSSSTEVIGNVWENPGLLQEKL